MTIRNRLLIGFAISTALAVAVLATILFSSREIAAQNRSRTSFHQILKAVSELDILTYEYVLHHEERAEEQWRLTHESLRHLLSAAGAEEEDAPLLARLSANDDVIANAFSHAKASHDRKQELQRDGAPHEQIAAAGAVEDRWVAQLMIASQSMISDASRLSERGGVRLLRTQSRARNLALVATLSLVACLLIVWFAVARSVAASLRRLHQGTDRIGLGDLDYRIGLDSGDELGALARSFDGMAEKLAAVTVSKERLQQEVAEREQAEEALRASEERLRLLGDNLPESAVYQYVHELDGTVRFLHVSAGIERLNGVRIEDVLRDSGTLHRQIPPEYFEPLLAAEARSARDLSDFDMEVPMRRADGQVRWMRLHSRPRRLPDGRTVWDGVQSDVSERKRAEEELRLAYGRLQTFFDHRIGGIGIVIANARGDILQANDHYLSILGFTREELASGEVDWRRMTPAEWLPADERALGQLRERGVCDTYEKEYVRRDGSRVPVLITDAMMPGDSGDILAFVLDITERKRAEEALRESEERFRLMGDTIPYGAWMADAEGRNIYISPLFLELVGMTFEQVKEFGWTGKMPPEDVEPTMRRWTECVRTGRDWEGELRFPSPDGRWHTILSRGKPVRDAQGQIKAWVGINLDITERKHAEEALQRAPDELAAEVEERTREVRQKEVLLKEVHHRVKNNLQVISSLVSLQADGSADETVREVLKDVTHRVRSMALVHEKLYQSPDLARVDFAEYVQSLLGYLWRAHGAAAAAIRLTLDLEPVSLPVDVAVPCGLILNELVGNALKHAFPCDAGDGSTPGRGRAEKESRCEVAVTLSTTPDGRVSLRVRDNGVGLPEGLDWSKTPSLGLRLVRMLAKQLDASAEVGSNQGTEFTVTFQGPNT